MRHGFRTTTAAFTAIMNVDAGGLIVKTGSHYKTVKVARVPSQGAGPAMADVVAGGVDFVTASLPEGRAMLKLSRAGGMAYAVPPAPLFFTSRPPFCYAKNQGRQRRSDRRTGERA